MISNIQSFFVSINAVEAVNKALVKRPRALKLSRPILDHKDTSEEKLMDVTTGAQDMLFRVTTVFPFTLFPDTITLDRQQLTIVHRPFFMSANTISVQIDDILNVETSVGPFFGSIHIYSKFFVNDIKSIDFLSRANAIMIQKMIQGYMIAHHKNIDCSTIEKEQLVIMLNELGQVPTS